MKETIERRGRHIDNQARTLEHYSNVYHGDGYDHDRIVETSLRSHIGQPSAASGLRPDVRVGQAASSSHNRATGGNPTGRSGEEAAANRGGPASHSAARPCNQCTRTTSRVGRSVGHVVGDDDDDDDDDSSSSDNDRVNGWCEEEAE